MDALCEGAAFRYGYSLETGWAVGSARGGLAPSAS